MTGMPTNDDFKQYIASVFDRASDAYDHVDADFFTPLGARLVERAELAPGDHVLDLGTGRGAALMPAASAVGPDGHVDGVDLASSMVEATAADLAARGITNATVHVGDAEQPPTRASGDSAGYDAITAALVIFMLPDPHAALRRWRDLLRPGGRLAFSTFAFGDDRWVDVFDTFTPYLPGDTVGSQLPPDDWYSTDDGTARALAGAGFQRIAMTTESIVTTFRDVDHWLGFTRSHGGLIAWDCVPEDAVPDVEAELHRRLTPLQSRDSSLELVTGVRFCTAQTPAS